MSELAEQIKKDGVDAIEEQSIENVGNFEPVMDGVRPATNKVRDAVREFESGRADEQEASRKMLLGISELARVAEELLFEMDARDLSSDVGDVVQRIRNEIE